MTALSAKTVKGGEQQGKQQSVDEVQLANE
jgi:hypothetical protein